MRAPVLLLAAALGLVSASASAHEGCAEDADCASGEVCFEEACSATCEEDADCAEGQVCSDGTACSHADEDDEGCSTAGDPGSVFPLFGVGLLAAVVRLIRLRRKR
ncbi:MAG: hypothetical protein HOV80_34135 [Polyangiaceae bacterium]|nr:hypothetical protein [Polyangiaceae bacterium]